MDAQVLPNGQVLIAEATGHRVTERDLKGDVLWEKKIDGEPTGCQRLPDGSTFVSTYNSVMEFAADGTKTYSFSIPGSNAIRKIRNGHIVYTQDDKIVEVDAAGKRVRTMPLPSRSMYVGVEDLPGDHFLVANSQKRPRAGGGRGRQGRLGGQRAGGLRRGPAAERPHARWSPAQANRA